MVIARKRKRKLPHAADVLIYTLIALLVVITVLPFMNIIAISMSSYGKVVSSTAMLFPQEFTLTAYRSVFTEKVMVSFLWTVVICLASSALHILVCLLTAYPLSKRELPGINRILVFILIPMLFSGGLVPFYQLIRSLGWIDSWQVFIFPGLFSGYNVILMKNFIRQIPSSIEEAARIDGAGYFHILFRIIMPLSMPIISCLLLFYAVGKWNDWFTGMIYINTKSYLYPLQTVLREILSTGNLDNFNGFTAYRQVYPESTKMAIVIFSIVPIACVYPFLQKYFVKGIFIGSVK